MANFSADEYTFWIQGRNFLGPLNEHYGYQTLVVSLSNCHRQDKTRQDDLPAFMANAHMLISYLNTVFGLRPWCYHTGPDYNFPLRHSSYLRISDICVPVLNVLKVKEYEYLV